MQEVIHRQHLAALLQRLGQLQNRRKVKRDGLLR